MLCNVVLYSVYALPYVTGLPVAVTMTPLPPKHQGFIMYVSYSLYIQLISILACNNSIITYLDLHDSMFLHTSLYILTVPFGTYACYVYTCIG